VGSGFEAALSKFMILLSIKMRSKLFFLVTSRSFEFSRRTFNRMSRNVSRSAPSFVISRSTLVI